MATITGKQKITACLWFDTEAEKTADFYCEVFKNSKKGKVSHYGDNAPMPKGTPLTVNFQLEGMNFMALNGGPLYKFTEAISFVISCTTQTEVDYFWDKLSDNGEKGQCGWLKDRFGMSWQVVPEILNELFTGDAQRSSRVMQVLMKMKKLDINALQEAYEGK